MNGQRKRERGQSSLFSDASRRHLPLNVYQHPIGKRRVMVTCLSTTLISQLRPTPILAASGISHRDNHKIITKRKLNESERKFAPHTHVHRAVHLKKPPDTRSSATVQRCRKAQLDLHPRRVNVQSQAQDGCICSNRCLCRAHQVNCIL
jgi:hypothetical protein